MTTHTPVLLHEAVDALDVQSERRYIDATYGLGGHSKLIAQKGGHVLGIDWDSESVKAHADAGNNTADVQNITVTTGNYADIAQIAREHDFIPVHGILFDLGLSMWHIQESQRGFTYQNDDEPLDMRLSDDIETTAADIVNSYTADELYEVFTKNAEELNSRPIADSIDKQRSVNAIETVGSLKDAIQKATKDPKSIARIFQALRIEVNNEFENITNGLEGAIEILDYDGKIVTIAFHPSEDRIIKKFIRKNKLKTHKKPIMGIKGGKPFERSAVLRIITQPS